MELARWTKTESQGPQLDVQVTTGAPKCSAVVQELSNTFISDPDSEIECHLRKCAADTNTKLSSTVHTREGRGASQRDLDSLEEWTHENLMKLNTCEYCKVLQLGQDNPRQYRPGELVGSSSAEKDLGGLVDENQPEPAVHVCSPESNCILDSIRRGNASRMGEVILSFCSTIVRTNLKYCIMSGGRQHNKDRNMLKQVQSSPWRK